MFLPQLPHSSTPAFIHTMTRSKPYSLTSSNPTHYAPNTLPDDAATHDEENVPTESPATDSASNMLTRGWAADLCFDKCWPDNECPHVGQLNTNFTTSEHHAAIRSKRDVVFFFPNSVLAPSAPKTSTFGDPVKKETDAEGNVSLVFVVAGQRMAMSELDNVDPSVQKPTLVYEQGEEPQTLYWTQFGFKAPQKP